MWYIARIVRFSSYSGDELKPHGGLYSGSFDNFKSTPVHKMKNIKFLCTHLFLTMLILI